MRVHQIELELQNEELRRTQTELAASHAKYFDIYDLAPVDYLSISRTGLILEANLSFSTLVEMKRRTLLKQPLSRFICPEDQENYYLHRKLLLLGYIEKEHKNFIIDFAGVDYIDSSGLGMLVAIRKRALENGGSIVIKGLHGLIKDLFVLTRLDKVFEIK